MPEFLFETYKRLGVQFVSGAGVWLTDTHGRRYQDALSGHALKKGLLINVTASRVIRLLPPLITNDAEADRIVALIGDIICGHVPDELP